MDNSQKLNILLSNDDGFDSPGINTLYEALCEIGEVTMVAPDKQNSAVSNALTMQNPLRAFPILKGNKQIGFRINGTPADCVKLALSKLLDRKPDIVISGINHGQNTSANIIYSGTVSAAYEGLVAGIPSIAVSLDSHDPDTNCLPAAKITKGIAKELMNNGLRMNLMLNVNVPSIEPEKIKGLKITKASRSMWHDNYELREDPWGRKYYWFAGEFNIDETDPDTDDHALRMGYVTITPLKFEFTDLDKMEQLKSIESIIFDK